MANGSSSVLDAFGSIDALEMALTKALPRGCEVANVYVGTGHANVCLGVTDAKALAELRDDVVLGSKFEESLNNKRSVSGRVRVDRGKFMECYARTMMRFGKLTPHQREKLQEVRAANVAVLLSPAGGGKTFLAIQRVLEELRGDTSAVVLFVARNTALALFVCKWLVYASQASADRIVDRIHVLVAPFEDGPRRVRVEAAGARRRLSLGSAGKCEYALVVVDEAHHLAGEPKLHEQQELPLVSGIGKQGLPDMTIPQKGITSYRAVAKGFSESHSGVITDPDVVDTAQVSPCGNSSSSHGTGRSAALLDSGDAFGCPPLARRALSLIHI